MDTAKENKRGEMVICWWIEAELIVWIERMVKRGYRRDRNRFKGWLFAGLSVSVGGRSRGYEMLFELENSSDYKCWTIKS